tara:strand:+ start:347 stop:598 length:252 start_codon:yes stop_codon:yes gene_type:complete
MTPMLSCFILAGTMFLSNGNNVMINHDHVWMAKKSFGNLMLTIGPDETATILMPPDWRSLPLPQIFAECSKNAVVLDAPDPIS